MATWDDVISDLDREVLREAGYGARMGFGERPVLMVIDVNHNFCGHEPEPLLQSVRTWRNSCGEEAWRAVARIAELLATARATGVPIIYTTGAETRPDGFDSGRWADKNTRRGEDHTRHPGDGNTIVGPLTPRPEDIVLPKRKPSAFFGTILPAYLVDLAADSVILCGATTSGCVRATAVDAFSYNYRVCIAEEATFDRADISHKVNLFDLHHKYADVVPVGTVISYLSGANDKGART